MINPKQRAYLKKIGHGMEPLIHIGKGGITENLITQIDQTLEKRELVKIKILNNNFEDRESLIQEILEHTKSDFVQFIGSKLMIYRPSEKDPTIRLPK